MKHSHRGHSLLGGSNAYIWLNCSGSAFLSSTLSAEIPTEASLDGTLTHELGEKSVSALLDYYLNGTEISELPIEDPERRKRVKNYTSAIWAKVLFESITNKAFEVESEVIISEELDMYGFVDFWVVYIDDKGKRCGAIVDLKDGRVHVNAEKSPQLAYYAVALREEMRRIGKDLEYVRGIIYQARSEDEAFKETKFSSSQLDTWKKKFIKAGEEIILHKKYKFKLGTWCKNCKARSKCETYTKHLEKESALKVLDTNSRLLPDIESVPNDVAVRVALMEKEIKSYITLCKSQALSLWRDGKLTNAKVVGTRPRRQFVKEPEAVQELISYLGQHDIAPEDCAVVRLKGIGDIEKLLKPIWGKEASKILEPFVTLTKSNPKLVSIDAPGTEITFDSSVVLLEEEEYETN